jgi:hypothetical protein
LLNVLLGCRILSLFKETFLFILELSEGWGTRWGGPGGLAPDLTLKPDIAAPGGNIYSTYPRALGSYATLSGTSMASPHTAGTVALTFSYEDAISPGGNTFTPSFYFDDTTVTFDKASLTLKPNQTAKVNVTITPPDELPAGTIYSGWIIATPEGNGQAIRVPYAGYIGSYQAVQVLTPTANGFPWLAYVDGPSLFKVTTGHTYTMSGDDVPNGQYQIVLKILKANGDKKNPAHWETWISPTITVQRP